MKPTTSTRAIGASCLFTLAMVASASLVGCDDGTGTGGAGGATSNASSTSASSTNGSTTSASSTTGATSTSTSGTGTSTSSGGMTSSSSGMQFCAYGNSDCKGCVNSNCFQFYNPCLMNGGCMMAMQTFDACVCDHQEIGDVAGIHDDCVVPFQQNGGMQGMQYVNCIENICSADAKCDLN